MRSFRRISSYSPETMQKLCISTKFLYQEIRQILVVYAVYITVLIHLNSIRSTASSCFDDVPAEHQTNSSFQLYGQVYDGDQQCKFTFGSIYKHCKTYMVMFKLTYQNYY